jgi:hypothetical protein
VCAWRRNGNMATKRAVSVELRHPTPKKTKSDCDSVESGPNVSDRMGYMHQRGGQYYPPLSGRPRASACQSAAAFPLHTCSRRPTKSMVCPVASATKKVESQASDRPLHCPPPSLKHECTTDNSDPNIANELTRDER